MCVGEGECLLCVCGDGLPVIVLGCILETAVCMCVFCCYCLGH